MNDQGVHWYLVVVDFSERKVYMLDSAPGDERTVLMVYMLDRKFHSLFLHYGE